MFRAIHQINNMTYDVHTFEDKAHFRAWMKCHPSKGFVPANRASGRKRQEINHVHEADLQVNLLRLDMELGIA